MTTSVATIPLSRQQQRIWAVRQFAPDSDGYCIPAAYRLTGPLDVDALDAALRAVINRHAVLRMGISQLDDGMPWQYRIDVPRRVLTVHDVAETDLTASIRARIRLPFADSALRLRADLFRLGAERFVLLLVFDHIAVDAPSVGLVLKEIGEGYGGALPDAAAADYATYVGWQREDPSTGDEFWTDYLRDLSFDAAHELGPGAETASLDVEVPAGLAAGAARLCVSPFALLMAAFSMTLRHFLRGPDVTVAFPAVDWRRLDLDPVVGLFTNLLVFRCPPLDDTPLRQYVLATQQTLLDCVDHQDAPLEAMWARLRAAEPGVATPRTRAMLSVDDTAERGLTLDGVAVTPMSVMPSQPKADFLLEARLRGGEALARLDYVPAVCPPAAASRLATAISLVLAQMLDSGPRTTRDVELLCDGDRKLLAEWNRQPGIERLELVPDAIAQQTAAAPDRIALTGEGRDVTYGELASRSGRLAARLRAFELPAGSTVALCLPRSIDYVVAAVAVLRAGMAFLPVDVEQPKHRMAFTISDGGSAAVVSDRPLPAGLGLPVIDSRTDGDGQVDAGGPVPWVAVDAGAPAYVITTSGSSGLPKAVSVPHRAIANNVAWKAAEFGLRRDDRFYFKTPPVFDASVWEYLVPLVIGATVVVAPAWAQHDPRHMLTEMRSRGVTVAQFVPTLLKAVLAEEINGPIASLRWMFAGGEALSGAVAAEVRDRVGGVVVNLYGPTEAAIDSTFHVCGDDVDTTAMVPIGRPVAGARAYVVGAGGQLLPPYFPGELHVAGRLLADGYVNRAELTEQRFVADPFQDAADARRYLTGDIVRRGHDGELEFLGREDGQVKVRGQRVELDEVRRQVLACAGVRDAAVAVREEALVAYVVANDDVVAALRTELAQRLPSSMRPEWLVRLDRLPTTATGKIDLRALPAPAADPPATAAGDLPRGELEQRLARLWAEVLGTTWQRVPRDVSLFDLGGSSLALIRLHRLLRAELPVEIAVTDLFKYPTVAAIARAVRGAEGRLS